MFWYILHGSFPITHFRQLSLILFPHMINFAQKRWVPSLLFHFSRIKIFNIWRLYWQKFISKQSFAINSRQILFRGNGVEILNAWILAHRISRPANLRQNKLFLIHNTDTFSLWWHRLVIFPLKCLNGPRFIKNPTLFINNCSIVSIGTWVIFLRVHFKHFF